MKTILIRSLSGAVYIALIVGSLLIDKSAFAMVLLVFNLIALNEFQQFNPQKGNSIFTLFTGVFAFILLHLIFIGLIPSIWGLSLTLIPVVFSLIGLYTKDENPLFSIPFALFSVFYITLPLVLLNYINIATEKSFSVLILCMFIIVWTNDTFAYLSGLAFGKHKLFERISPKKTWEGFFGGLIVALIFGYFLHRFINDISITLWLVLTVIIATTSVLGDFVESLFKRTAGIKDSGNIMPGHGGMLDRIDSLLFVAPILYFYLQLIN